MDIIFEAVPSLGRRCTYSYIVIGNRPIGYMGQDRFETAYIVIYGSDNSNTPAMVKLFSGKDPKSNARNWLTKVFSLCRLDNRDSLQLSPLALFKEATRQAEIFETL